MKLPTKSEGFVLRLIDAPPDSAVAAKYRSDLEAAAAQLQQKDWKKASEGDKHQDVARQSYSGRERIPPTGSLQIGYPTSYRVGRRRSISFIFSAAHRIAQIVAGHPVFTRGPIKPLDSPGRLGVAIAGLIEGRIQALSETAGRPSRPISLVLMG